MSKKRSYEDACGIARALDTVGERWSLMVVRELLLGPKRFTDLRNSLPGIGPDVLTQRLKDLEAAGIARKHKLPPPAASTVYELTPAGLALEPALQALGRWGGAYAPPPSEGMCMSLDAHLLSLRTLFSPALAGDLRSRVSLRLDGQDFYAIVADGECEVERGTVDEPDVTITGAAAELFSVVRGAETMDTAPIEVEGDRELAARFFELFPLPVAA
jgi:DNA-binding HxlR family transcriptional regulator